MSMTKLREIIRQGIIPSKKTMRPEIVRILSKYGNNKNDETMLRTVKIG